MAQALRPLFVNVTWGAGGSTAMKSLELAEICQRQLGLTTCLHLTCTNMSRKLVDEALDNADLNGFLEAAIRALPDSVVNAALKTDDVLVRAIDDLDLRALLANVDDPDELNAQVEAAVTRAVQDSLTDRLRDLLP